METGKLDTETNTLTQGDYLFWSTNTMSSKTNVAGLHKKTTNTLRADGSVGSVLNPETNLHLGHNPDAIWMLNWNKK